MVPLSLGDRMKTILQEISDDLKAINKNLEKITEIKQRIYAVSKFYRMIE